MPSKITDSLTPLEVVDLLESLAQTESGEKLRVIKEEAAKRGVQVSLMAAATFRDEKLKPYLEKIRNAKMKSQALAEAMTDGSEEGLLATGRIQLAEQVTDFLMTEEVTPKQFGPLAKTLSMLSSSSQNERALRLKLDEYERKEAERKEAIAAQEAKKAKLAAAGGISEEALRLMEETLKILS